MNIYILVVSLSLILPALNRNDHLQKLLQIPQWDIIVIGGGATGLGIALDAATRGYTTLLVEKADFAKGTSSKSTKLVHGGVEYLAQGNISLVYGALRERGIMLKNAPHLVKKQAFVIPCYSWDALATYWIGLKIYDWLSGNLSLGKSQKITAEEMISTIPVVNKKGLKGGVVYYDGQFDDARFAINLAQSIATAGGSLLNYCKVKSLSKSSEGKINGVTATDVIHKKEYNLKAKCVINATGVFVDAILNMDVPQSRPLVKLSQGVHLVFKKNFLEGTMALMIPKTSDGRVLFAVPWHDAVLVGTTDTPTDTLTNDPAAFDTEVAFILQSLNDYFSRSIERDEVLSVFAGLRPLVAPEKGLQRTKEISRDHKLIISESGLITITGGKWTTYRKMAEDAVNTAQKVAALPQVACTTQTMKIHGYTTAKKDSHLAIYGTDAKGIEALIQQDASLAGKIVVGFPFTKAEILWAIRNEMAMTVEDVLARRIRLLFLNAAKAKEAAPVVAQLLRAELNETEEWERAQLQQFNLLADHYLLK